jgi:hypothetical protein
MGNGHQGDIEFGVWTHEAVSNGGSAGRFIGSSTLGAGDINTGGQSFGLYANPNSSPLPFAASTREFAKPALTTGDTLSFKLTVSNRSPGNRGFDLRNSAGAGVFNFDVRSGGYYVNGDGGGSLNASHHPNTVFTFTFTQRERRMEYVIERSGGISARAEGFVPLDSGTVADVRFYISGAGSSGGAANNLYFNQFALTTEVRGDAPLTIGERRQPGKIPSYFLRFSDPTASSVTLRHGGDGYTTSYPLTLGEDGIWSIDVRPILSTSGWHQFKFRLNSEWESGANRWLYVDSQGRVAMPPVVYLTWQRDPATTMTVHWYNDEQGQNQLRWRRLSNGGEWSSTDSTSQALPHTERFVRTAEITGLDPDTVYEFQVDGYTESFRFRTMPDTLTRPVKFGVGGDVDVGAVADAVTTAICSKDPDFLVVGGDHAYEDAKAENYWRWMRYMESWFRNARGADGRIIPLVVGIGNHEVLFGWGANHPDFEDTASWRDRYASYYYRTFSFPGAQRPYGVLDFGNYLSLIVTDTEHTSPIISGNDNQTQWLAGVLNSRRHMKHIIPIHHVPAYPSNRAFADTIPSRIRQHWVPLYENSGVKLVFENHDHAFKRTKPLLNGLVNSRGIIYAGDGLWGVDSRAPDSARSYIDTSSQDHHTHLVTITENERSVEAVRSDGGFFGGRIIQSPDGIPNRISPSISSLNGSSLTLSWSGVAGADFYRVTRSDGVVAEATGTSYSDTTWSPEGGYGYTVEAINRAGASEPSNQSRPSHRQLWNLSNNLPWDGSGVDGDSGDADGDGIPNLHEYFHGTNPAEPEALQPLQVDGLAGGAWRFRYRKNPDAEGIDPRVMWTNDLTAGGWVEAEGVHEALDGDHSGWIRFSTPVGPTQGRGFYKLNLE